VRKDRLIVGALRLAYAVWIFLSGETGGTVAPAIVFTVFRYTGSRNLKKEIVHI